jgi:cysteine-rich repeat protein
MKADLLRSFRETGFCGSGTLSTFYEIMEEVLSETVDVLGSGDSNPNEPCDALSYGFGFEAAQVTPGKAVTLPPRIECCEPGKTAEACKSMCGDGEVKDDEKCDTAIAAGEPGACPTACETTDACKPQKLVDSNCSAACQEMPITMVGADDDCCPPGADISSDGDCRAQCGNGVVETGETCDPPGTCGQCPTNPCFTARMTGSADSCNVRCEYQPIITCAASDGCCPAMCTPNNDSDCSRSCNNNQLNEGELCENGTSTPCPMSCDDGNACTSDRRSGSPNNCSVSCFSTAIVDARNGDGCCPPGASANTDDGCEPRCGNRAVERGEQCDDGNFNPGDGCVDCRTESEQMQCLMKLGSDDACARCTCVNCADEGMACYDHADPNEARLCRDLVECQYEHECGTPDCYCGDVSLFGCFAGAANGPCRTQTERAARADSVLEIQQRSTDLNYPLGLANALFTCVGRFCSMECGRRN